MANIYLDTSFFSACVSDRPDAASTYRRDISREWWMTQRRQHQLFSSAEVIRELSSPAYPHRTGALVLTTETRSLQIDEEVEGVSSVLVREGVMPGPVGAGDAVHVAVAIVRRLVLCHT